MKPKANRAQLVCENGQGFRPSDWSVRLAGLDAQFGPDQRLRYSRYIKPVSREGKRCLCLDGATATERPSIYQAIMHFARQNRLAVIPA